MPIYEYRCGSCAQTFDVLAKFSDPDPTVCEHCEAVGQLAKVLHPAAVHYKGSGFYATDYSGSKASSSDAKDSPAGSDSGSGGGDSGASSPDKMTSAPKESSGGSATSTAGAAAD